jgi:divalent metal cation (Fe/Co/Zn/Cd) transporter
VEGRMPPAMLSLVAILAALSLAWVGLTAPWPWLAPLVLALGIALALYGLLAMSALRG